MRIQFKYAFLLFILFIACAKTETEDLPEDEEIIGHTNPKKGFCITTNNLLWYKKIEDLYASWHYSWNYELHAQEPEGVEFVPMIWGAWADTAKVQAKIDYIKNLKAEGKAKFMLGFNEPDKTDQANMSVEGALAYWPKLEAVGLPLGSPACANPTGEWMQTFMEEAANRNLRIDFICVHWYGGVSVPGFLSRLQEIHELYNKPVWITEFAPADWNASTPAESKHTKAEILSFMKEVLPALDDLDYVERYAWFSAKESSGPLGNAALFNDSNQLTTLGEFYASFGGK